MADAVYVCPKCQAVAKVRCANFAADDLYPRPRQVEPYVRLHEWSCTAYPESHYGRWQSAVDDPDTPVATVIPRWA